MKPSPLQLKWVTYPAASFKALETYDGEPGTSIAALVDSSVEFNVNGLHVAHVAIRNNPETVSPYEFAIVVMAQFSFDLDRAKETYRPSAINMLPPAVAANVCRILYAGARELLSIMTSRAPFFAAMLDSVLIEPQDVSIESDAPPETIFKEIFGVSDEEIEAIRPLVSGEKGGKKSSRNARAAKSRQ